MLTLRRKANETVRVLHRSGDEVVVRVERIKGNQVTLAFLDPPRHFEIIRPSDTALEGQPEARRFTQKV